MPVVMKVSYANMAGAVIKMKQRKLRRRRDGVKQHYNYGRKKKSKKDFGFAPSVGHLTRASSDQIRKHKFKDEFDYNTELLASNNIMLRENGREGMQQLRSQNPRYFQRLMSEFEFAKIKDQLDKKYGGNTQKLKDVVVMKKSYSYNPIKYYADAWDKKIYCRSNNKLAPKKEQLDYNKYMSHGINPKKFKSLGLKR